MNTARGAVKGADVPCCSTAGRAPAFVRSRSFEGGSNMPRTDGLAGVLFAYFLGNVTAVITSANASSGKYREMIGTMRGFIITCGRAAAQLQWHHAHEGRKRWVGDPGNRTCVFSGPWGVGWRAWRNVDARER